MMLRAFTASGKLPWVSLTPEINDSTHRKPLGRGWNDPLESAFTLTCGVSGSHCCEPRQGYLCSTGVKSHSLPRPQDPNSPNHSTGSSIRQPPSLGHAWGRKLEAQLCRQQLLGSICGQKWGFVFLNRKPSFFSFPHTSKAAD